MLPMKTDTTSDDCSLLLSERIEYLNEVFHESSCEGSHRV
jgi:hypothetical protein